jgi:hypothetical protein
MRAARRSSTITCARSARGTGVLTLARSVWVGEEECVLGGQQWAEIRRLVHGDTQGNAPGSKWAAAIIEYGDYPQSDVMRSRSVVQRARRSAVLLDFG